LHNRDFLFTFAGNKNEAHEETRNISGYYPIVPVIHKGSPR